MYVKKPTKINNLQFFFLNLLVHLLLKKNYDNQPHYNIHERCTFNIIHKYYIVEKVTYCIEQKCPSQKTTNQNQNFRI